MYDTSFVEELNARQKGTKPLLCSWFGHFHWYKLWEVFPDRCKGDVSILHDSYDTVAGSAASIYLLKLTWLSKHMMG